jgi:hypothetical protein
LDCSDCSEEREITMKRIILAILLITLASCSLIPEPRPTHEARADASIQSNPFNPTHDPAVCGGWSSDGTDQGVVGYGFGGRGYVMKDGRVVVDETCPAEFWGRVAAAKMPADCQSVYESDECLRSVSWLYERLQGPIRSPAEIAADAAHYANRDWIAPYANYGKVGSAAATADEVANRAQAISCMHGLIGCWRHVRAPR